MAPEVICYVPTCLAPSSKRPLCETHWRECTELRGYFAGFTHRSSGEWLSSVSLVSAAWEEWFAFRDELPYEEAFAFFDWGGMWKNIDEKTEFQTRRAMSTKKKTPGKKGGNWWARKAFWSKKKAEKSA
jgi:hypothetical protein